MDKLRPQLKIGIELNNFIQVQFGDNSWLWFDIYIRDKINHQLYDTLRNLLRWQLYHYQRGTP